MATWKFVGMEDFINLCIHSEKQLDRTIGRSIYPGALVMANALKEATANLVTDDGKGAKHRAGSPKRRGPTPEQKQALIGSFGIAIIRKNVYGYNVKAGWDGYNGIVTARWPKGQPNAMVARSVNAGTSFMSPQPFVDNTVRRMEQTTVTAIEKEFENQLRKIWN